MGLTVIIEDTTYGGRVALMQVKGKGRYEIETHLPTKTDAAIVCEVLTLLVAAIKSESR